ncbi:GNAT family N-acetyltransferase [Staphylococcus sp. 18_1_E_LY]|uniref:GNAT family N-acetyltransferase n=1 Tax=Staphylococcus lloydii TaxID=2781774 RepID=A0A7T1AYP5_9STAP|nr:GNAT family N-acetyltransferase [Staphylococcus lloydii]MBF7019185.1 GNAT family N-acetyltransferase [Staphylococcus lloydii]MBF7026913.1 GNAT family N-acetyltransferase [Staphylococcus lloydii]QPM74563.1 GNAT family N-acetyltransferase [Staphylococcus lloydii]
MYFKKAQLKDIELIYDLMIQSFTEYETDEIPPNALKEREEDVLEGFKRNEESAFIAYESNKPLGMVRFQVEDNILYFFRLSVLPKYRNKGIGKSIITYLESFARENGISEIICKVRQNVTKNLKLYSSLGFHIYDEYFIIKSNNKKLEMVKMKKYI